MFGSGWPGLLKGLAAGLCILGIVSLALIYFIPTPPSTILIATSQKGGGYEFLGQRYRAILARKGVKVLAQLQTRVACCTREGRRRTSSYWKTRIPGSKSALRKEASQTVSEPRTSCHWVGSTISRFGYFIVGTRSWIKYDNSAVHLSLSERKEAAPKWRPSRFSA